MSVDGSDGSHGTRPEVPIPPQERLRIEVGRLAAAGSLQGPAHRVNEDTWRIVEPVAADGSPSDRLYLVADGVGGRSRGEVASALAAQVVAAHYFADAERDRVTRLIDAVREANRRVTEAAGADELDASTMATTIVAALIAGNTIAVAHAGDSRCYLAVDHVMTQLTHDHSWVQEQLDRGEITPAEARVSSHRNIITRALGLGDGIEPDVSSDIPLPVVGRLFLCSDGVHGVVDDDELLELTDGVAARTGVERILAKVNERAGRDDATIVIVELVGRPDSPAGRTAPRTSVLARLRGRFRRRGGAVAGSRVPELGTQRR